MSDTQEKNEGKKLDWMYRDASQIVDREEYLLGRKVDKQFEASVLPPGKDQECLPPSLFSRGVHESQVDTARKLQEDPLYLIKKKEIEFREQLLKNPRKMKQLQEMIAKQNLEAEKLQRKAMKKKKKKDLDALLVKKCNKLFGGDGTKKLAMLDNIDSESNTSSESDSSATEKDKKRKKKKRKDLDKALALKFKKVKGNLNAEKIAEIDSSSSSDSEEEMMPKRKKEKQKSDRKRKFQNESKRGRESKSSEEEIITNKRLDDSGVGNWDSKKIRQSKHKKHNETHKKSPSNDMDSSADEKKSNKSHVHKEHARKDKNDGYKTYSSRRCPENDKYVCKERDGFRSRSRHTNENRLSNEREETRSTHKSGHKYSREREETRLRHTSSKNIKEQIQKDEKKYSRKDKLSRSSSESTSDVNNSKSTKGKKKGRFTKSSSSSESDSKSTKKSKSSKGDKTASKKDSSTSTSSESSSEETKRQPTKKYGLVLPANYVPKKQPMDDMKPTLKQEKEPAKSYKKEQKVKLTDEEKERKLKEMMDNARWRDEQRDKNVKAYREKEKSEKDDYVYNEHFLRKQMAIAVSQGTVESRVKANINTIQRSGASMNEHFARRK